MLNKLADASGQKLIFYSHPPGKFTRRDSNSYSVDEAKRIIGRELEVRGYRLLDKAEHLIVVDLREVRNRYLAQRVDGFADESLEQPTWSAPRKSVSRPGFHVLQASGALTALAEEASVAEAFGQDPPRSKKHVIGIPIERDFLDVSRDVYQAIFPSPEKLMLGDPPVPTLRISLTGAGKEGESVTLSFDRQARVVEIESPEKYLIPFQELVQAYSSRTSTDSAVRVVFTQQSKLRIAKLVPPALIQLAAFQQSDQGDDRPNDAQANQEATHTHRTAIRPRGDCQQDLRGCLDRSD